MMENLVPQACNSLVSSYFIFLIQTENTLKSQYFSGWSSHFSDFALCKKEHRRQISPPSPAPLDQSDQSCTSFLSAGSSLPCESHNMPIWLNSLTPTKRRVWYYGPQHPVYQIVAFPHVAFLLVLNMQWFICSLKKTQLGLELYTY